MTTVPVHRSEQTGNPALDRIQNNVRSLLEFVRGLLWLTRRAYVELATDSTTASATYATLLTATITSALARSYLVVSFTASGGHPTNLGTAYFQILLDGVVATGCYTTVPAAYAWNAAAIVRVPVTAGMHTVLLQWKTDSATLRISAATANEEHAAMSIHEEAA